MALNRIAFANVGPVDLGAGFAAVVNVSAPLAGTRRALAVLTCSGLAATHSLIVREDYGGGRVLLDDPFATAQGVAIIEVEIIINAGDAAVAIFLRDAGAPASGAATIRADVYEETGGAGGGTPFQVFINDQSPVVSP